MVPKRSAWVEEPFFDYNTPEKVVRPFYLLVSCGIPLQGESSSFF